MSEDQKSYEAMFLVDATDSDFHAASEAARVALERNQAEVLSMKPWDERRLAYAIRGRRRGLYILAYFKAPPDQIQHLERDCQLDERVLRLLVLRRDDLKDEEINADTPATANARRAAARRAEEPAREQAAAAPTPPEAPPGGPPKPSEAPAPKPEAAAPAKEAAPQPAGADKPGSGQPPDDDKPADGDKADSSDAPTGDEAASAEQPGEKPEAP